MMGNFILKYLWASYLGFSICQFTNIKVFDWQFFVIILPVIIFEHLRVNAMVGEVTKDLIRVNAIMEEIIKDSVEGEEE